MHEVVNFDGFQFNSTSGELISHDEKGRKNVQRLQPQSAQLLKLLLENAPNILSKEHIKMSLWPDVQVDFDNSLHFCIRQIRSALNDDHKQPKFIETIPRRGYRWIAEVETKKKERKHTRFVVPIILIAIVLAVVLFPPNRKQENSSSPEQKEISLAIMPIQTTDTSNYFCGNTIANDLLLKTSNNSKFAVTGPTTTQGIHQNELYQFIEASEFDFVINGKISGQEENSSLLMEIIRSNDGAHLWVERFDSSSNFSNVSTQTYRALLQNLK